MTGPRCKGLNWWNNNVTCLNIHHGHIDRLATGMQGFICMKEGIRLNSLSTKLFSPPDIAALAILHFWSNLTIVKIKHSRSQVLSGAVQGTVLLVMYYFSLVRCRVFCLVGLVEIVYVCVSSGNFCFFLVVFIYIVIGRCLLWEWKTWVTLDASMQILDTLSMGCMKIGDMKKWIWHVFIDGKVFISILSKYFLHSKACSFLIRPVIFQCVMREFSGLSQCRCLFCSHVSCMRQICLLYKTQSIYLQANYLEIQLVNQKQYISDNMKQTYRVSKWWFFI